MIPNMYKIAGELTPTVFHVAARAVAAQALSIFGDHSDVMAVRQTGFAMLASSSVQEAHDLAAVAHSATLSITGAFRALLRWLPDIARAQHDRGALRRRPSGARARGARPCTSQRALSPERPFIRGTAQNPDVYFQARETSNPFYARTPALVEEAMANLAERTGRRYHLVDYTGHPEAERVSSSWGRQQRRRARPSRTSRATGERVGVVTVRLYRPFPTEALLAALPADGEAGRRARPDKGARFARGAALPRRRQRAGRGARERPSWNVMPLVIGGRYGLVLEGVHARHGRRRCSRSLGGSNLVAASPSASTTTSRD